MVLLGGMQRGLMELIDNGEVVKAAVSHRLKLCRKLDEIVLQPGAPAIMWGNDFGYKSGPLCNPAMFREFFLEANKARVQYLHGTCGKKVLKHCCGNIEPLLDDFIEIGYDAYQSIQSSAGMDICRIKKTHGDRITLWGGVAVENLVSGTTEDVRKDVRRAISCAKEGGRFILGSSHSIAVGTRYENFMAMLDEHEKLSRY